MDARLYQAALTGNVAILKELLQEDERILDRIPIQEEFGINETPLHTSALLGHVDFARAILLHKPQLASKPNSQGSLPLHLAAAKGHVAIVQELLKVNEKISDMCLARDRQGQTPLHVAAAAGRVEVLNELVRANPVAMRAPTLKGDSVFHLCVKRNHFAALKPLVDSEDAANLINFKDSEDNTVLHLATAKKNIQMLEMFLRVDGVDVEAKNEHGFTALDVLTHSPSERGDGKIFKILKNAGCKRGSDSFADPERNEGQQAKQIHKNYLIAATVIATVTFTAGYSPPGSVWTELSEPPKPSAANDHKPGTAIFANNWEFDMFLMYNTVGFLASCTIIFPLVTGMEFKDSRITLFVSFAFGVAIGSLVLAFFFGAALVSFPSKWHASKLLGIFVYVFLFSCYACFRSRILKCSIIRKLGRRDNRLVGTTTDIEGGQNIV